MTTTLTEAQATTMSQRLFAWLDALTAAAAAEGFKASRLDYEIDPPRKGQRYVRIVTAYQSLRDGQPFGAPQRSVHAFYDLRTGDVYKAAGWKAPAKHVRYNLLDDASFANMMGNLDPHGAYLYIR